MYTQYRMSYPYFGLYKYKISLVRNFQEHENIFLNRITTIKDFLKNNWKDGKDYKFTNAWNIYLRDKDVFDNVANNNYNAIQTVYLPAPGYEHLVGKPPRQNKILWYDKFPYKILLDNIERGETVVYLDWCKKNLKGETKCSSGYNSASFYFMNSMDAVAFKLQHGDKVAGTYVADSDKAAELLKERIERANREYYDYIEGEGLDDC